MKFEIKNWITGKVMFALEGADWKLAFVAAVKAGQEFKEADLSETLDKAEQSLFAVSQKFLKNKFIPINSILTEAEIPAPESAPVVEPVPTIEQPNQIASEPPVS